MPFVWKSLSQIYDIPKRPIYIWIDADKSRWRVYNNLCGKQQVNLAINAMCLASWFALSSALPPFNDLSSCPSICPPPSRNPKPNPFLTSFSHLISSHSAYYTEHIVFAINNISASKMPPSATQHTALITSLNSSWCHLDGTVAHPKSRR